MAPDRFSAIWISHSSINDYLHCKRAYFLKNVYRDSKTHHKIKIVAPPLALGMAVHEVLESIATLPVAERFNGSLGDRFEKAWEKVKGKNGGFTNDETESKYKARGRDMISRVVKNPGPLAEKAVRIKDDLPHFWISEDQNIILCGKIDWLQYIPETDSVHIIDFKTSKNSEDGNSLQLPIYYLIVKNCQHRPVTKMSYWYIDRDDAPIEVSLPDEEEALKKINGIALEIKLARQLNRFTCDKGGCDYCKPLETVLKGEAEFVGYDGVSSDLYIIDESLIPIEDMSEIL